MKPKHQKPMRLFATTNGTLIAAKDADDARRIMRDQWGYVFPIKLVRHSQMMTNGKTHFPMKPRAIASAFPRGIVPKGGYPLTECSLCGDCFPEHALFFTGRQFLCSRCNDSSGGNLNALFRQNLTTQSQPFSPNTHHPHRAPSPSPTTPHNTHTPTRPHHTADTFSNSDHKPDTSNTPASSSSTPTSQHPSP